MEVQILQLSADKELVEATAISDREMQRKQSEKDRGRIMQLEKTLDKVNHTWEILEKLQILLFLIKERQDMEKVVAKERDAQLLLSQFKQESLTFKIREEELTTKV